MAKVGIFLKKTNLTNKFVISLICGMFTGIIEALGRVEAVTGEGSNKTFVVSSPISSELKIDQSVSHNGVCLTVESVADGVHTVTAIAETLEKTSLGNWTASTIVNLERCLPLHGRLDGHLVQGHVDATGTCLSVTPREGSWEFDIGFPERFAALIIEKGSVSLNGISLTVFNVGRDRFTVAIIPYTYEHTNMHDLKAGDAVNIEFDMVGKYIQRSLSLK